MSTESPSNHIESSSNNISPPTTTPTSIPDDATFSSLNNYPFTSDPAFLAGLSQILGHPGTPITETELAQKPDLVLSAKCFYFSRKFQTPTPIDPGAYKRWLSLNPQQHTPTFSSTEPSIPAATTTPPPPTSQSLTPSEPLQSQSEPQPQPQQPPYPTSFAAIVDLITNNKPIPGIEEIPTTVLEAGSSKQDKATRRRKPWEKDTDADVDQETAPAETTSHQTQGDIQGQQNDLDEPYDKADHDQGLLRLLRPDAVPDSGLVAKD